MNSTRPKPNFDIDIRFGHTDNEIELLKLLKSCPRPVTWKELQLLLQKRGFSERSISRQLASLSGKVKLVYVESVKDEREQEIFLSKPLWMYTVRKW